MIVSIILIWIFIIRVRYADKVKLNLVVFTAIGYIGVILLEQYYLETVYLRSFHVSDPSYYFEVVEGLSFSQISESIRENVYSNRFYVLLNWMFWYTFRDPSLVAVLMKCTNVIALLLAYLIATEKRSKVDYVDFLILHHPFVYLMAIRNIRDFYIILALVVVVSQFKTADWNRGNVWKIVAASLFMYTLRPFFLVLFGLLFVLRGLAARSSIIRALFLVTTAAIFVLAIILSGSEIYTALLSAFISVLATGGELAEHSDEYLRAVMDDNSMIFDFSSQFVFRIAKAFAVFLFTPHPINSLRTTVFAESSVGFIKMYTDFDEILIALGGMLNYMIIIPILLKVVHKLSVLKCGYAISALFFAATYSIFQLGSTDPRIKYGFIFLLLCGFRDGSIKSLTGRADLIYYAASFIVFLAIAVIK
jgi:hypothetical protein